MSSEKERQLRVVRENGLKIKYISSPDEEVQFAAVSQNGHAIQFIDNPSEWIQLAAVGNNGLALRHIFHKKIQPTERVLQKAVQNYGLSIRYIQHPSKEVCDLAFQNDPRAGKYIPYRGYQYPDQKLASSAYARSFKEYHLFAKNENGIDFLSPRPRTTNIPVIEDQFSLQRLSTFLDFLIK